MAGGTIEFTETNFEQEVLQASTPVLVDLWAAWCGPCRMLAPVVEEFAGKYQGKVKVGKLNVDDHPALAGQYRVMNIPTLLLFKDGQLADTIVGLQSKEDIAAKIESAAENALEPPSSQPAKARSVRPHRPLRLVKVVGRPARPLRQGFRKSRARGRWRGANHPYTERT